MFAGNNWKLKNGDKAVAVFRKLKSSGIDAELNLVGRDIPLLQEEGINIVGPLNKDCTRDYFKLIALFRSSSFFFLMSRAEAFGHVFDEAASFALPSIASDVNGIPGAVHHGTNGIVFPVDTDEGVIAREIASLYHDKEAYYRLSRSSYIDYRNRLNWQSITKKILETISACI